MGKSKHKHASNKDVMGSRRSLRTEIEALIEPHRCSDQKPPFSVAELVICSIICNDICYPTKGEIFAWIIYTFRYYSSLAISGYIKYVASVVEWQETDSGDFVHEFTQVFKEYEVPLVERHRKFKPPTTWAQVIERQSEDRSSTWTVKPSQARLFLFSHLERPGIFRLFDLPRELRDRVYEALLVYPEPEIMIHSTPMATRRISDKIGTSKRERKEQCYYTVKDFSKNLQFLQTCRQMYKEAMPIHQGSNRYVFREDISLACAFARLSPDRARHLKNLFVYIEQSSHGKTKSIACASQLSLERLTVTFRSYHTVYGKYPEMDLILALARGAKKFIYKSGKKEVDPNSDTFVHFLTKAGFAELERKQSRGRRFAYVSKSAQNGQNKETSITLSEGQAMAGDRAPPE